MNYFTRRHRQISDRVLDDVIEPTWSARARGRERIRAFHNHLHGQEKGHWENLSLQAQKLYSELHRQLGTHFHSARNE